MPTNLSFRKKIFGQLEQLSNVKNILIFVNSSWGEIDWLLPVCNYLKNNYPKVKQYVLINDFDSNKIIKGNEFLYNLLSESVDKCYNFNDFLPRHIKWFLNVVKEKILKKVHSQKLKF